MTTNNIALGFISHSNLPSFYEAARRTKNIDDATAPSFWAREELSAVKNISDIAELLNKKVQDVTNNPHAKVALVVDPEFLSQSQFPPTTPTEFLNQLRGVFSGSLQTVLIGPDKQEISAFTEALENFFSES